MTNLEAIKAKVALNYPIEDATFDVAVAESGLEPDDTFVGGRSFDFAFIGIIDSLLASAERISEGGYTVQLNLDALFRLRSMLYRKWGVPDPSAAYLIDRTNRW